MTEEQIFIKVRNIIAKRCHVPEEKVTSDTDLYSDYCFCRINQLCVLEDLKTEFSIFTTETQDEKLLATFKENPTIQPFIKFVSDNDMPITKQMSQDDILHVIQHVMSVRDDKNEITMDTPVSYNYLCDFLLGLHSLRFCIRPSTVFADIKAIGDFVKFTQRMLPNDMFDKIYHTTLNGVKRYIPTQYRPDKITLQTTFQELCSFDKEWMRHAYDIMYYVGIQLRRETLGQIKTVGNMVEFIDTSLHPEKGHLKLTPQKDVLPKSIPVNKGTHITSDMSQNDILRVLQYMCNVHGMKYEVTMNTVVPEMNKVRLLYGVFGGLIASSSYTPLKMYSFLEEHITTVDDFVIFIKNMLPSDTKITENDIFNVVLQVHYALRSHHYFQEYLPEQITRQTILNGRTDSLAAQYKRDLLAHTGVDLRDETIKQIHTFGDIVGFIQKFFDQFDKLEERNIQESLKQKADDGLGLIARMKQQFTTWRQQMQKS